MDARILLILLIIPFQLFTAQEMDTDGYLNVKQVIRLTDNDSYNHSPNWSPDGSKIAFCRRRDGDTDIFIMALATKEIILEIKSDDKDLSPK